MVSLYTSAFNVIKNQFKWEDALNNFSKFADEVVVAVNTSDDSTLDILKKHCFEKRYSNVFFTVESFSYEDPLFDVKLKNAALQKTSGNIKVGLDFDERIPLRHKARWRVLGDMMMRLGEDAYSIPMINLWGNERKMRQDQYIVAQTKWYMHRAGLYRGVVNFAKLPSGKIDVTKSDTCELIYSDGELVKATRFIKPVKSEKEYYEFLENEGVFVFHTGYADFKNTVEKNVAFWKPHWELRSGKPYKMPTKVKEMEQYKTAPHGLRLWNE